MSELPKGWISAKFSELNQFSSSTIEPTKSSCETFELYSVPAFPMRSPELALGSDIGSTKQTVAENDVLVCKINPRINRVWTVLKCSSYRKIASSEWIGFRSVALHSRYAQFYFQSPKFRDLLCADVTGVGGSLTRAQPKRVATFDVPVAPLPEQKRIAEKLDATLARVDACRERLTRITPTLKRFRQSVLAAATSGQLTADWREGQCNLDVDSISIELTDSSNTPVNLPSRSNPFTIKRDWTFYPVTTLSQVADSRLGKMLDKAKNSGNPTPYLGNINVRWFSFDVTNLQKIYIEEKEAEELRLRKGDVLICEGGEPGRCAIWMQESSEIIFQKALHRVRPHQGVLLSSWLVYSLKFAAESKRLDEYFTGTTIKHFTGRSLAKYELPLPSLSEQIEIVRRVETLFAFADRLEARLASATAAAERLTPSLLAKAFRGELVPQDPNDEPASELLKRLAASRESAGKAPKAKRGRKPAAA
ncbi:restriction endonuclease subunit S [Aquitalea sp. LB_tupeE]|uniref:restriction endonuclease subunit S n=1 Tax=Aquitalea sp. LB_tupeE TaxID=2748078 RepID=UPI0015BF0E49|nr:restriction endonuclease subunit S [Aquitalea sp. LB_tupeE]NWK79556.1 restriction endonuclease subunit S [Aquitalea sp. LB_tupeE]